ncbi:MAG: hypothetical protein RJB62_384, partial [Pseudomonadota bacterium]
IAHQHHRHLAQLPHLWTRRVPCNSLSMPMVQNIRQVTLKGKYDTAIDPESAQEMLARRTGTSQNGVPSARRGAEPEKAEKTSFWGSIFGTSRKRGERLTTGQHITRQVTRSVTNQVAGKIAADIGKSILGDRIGGTVGRAIVRGTLGGILRR